MGKMKHPILISVRHRGEGRGMVKGKLGIFVISEILTMTIFKSDILGCIAFYF
jgi:uncharacterized protein (UPF0216 family)